MNMKKITINLSFLMLLISGCTNDTTTPATENNKPKIPKDYINVEYNQNENHIYKNLNNTIIDIADQLLESNVKKTKDTKIILTSFVNLDDLSTTTTLGRLLGESMYNELHIRKFKVTDFRGQDAVSVDKDGEYHITRDTEKLKDNIADINYILVGTYSKFEDNSLLINSRILDSITGDVISSARVIYQPRDCRIYNLCSNTKLLENDTPQTNNQDKSPIIIIEDD